MAKFSINQWPLSHESKELIKTEPFGFSMPIFLLSTAHPSYQNHSQEGFKELSYPFFQFTFIAIFGKIDVFFIFRHCLGCVLWKTLFLCILNLRIIGYAGFWVSISIWLPLHFWCCPYMMIFCHFFCQWFSDSSIVFNKAV